jgi:hypothetical protein
VVAHSRQRVAEGCVIFLVPTGLAHRQILWVEHLGHERHQAEKAKETGRGAFDGPVRPLALGFKTEASTQFFKGDLNRPLAKVMV